MFNEFYKKARKNVYGNYLKYKEKPYYQIQNYINEILTKK